MKKFSLFFLFILILVSACSSNKFDQKVWFAHEFDDSNNPRLRMTDDLMRNYIKVGMSKSDVIKLLGDSCNEEDSITSEYKNECGYFVYSDFVGDSTMFDIFFDNEDKVIDFHITQG